MSIWGITATFVCNSQFWRILSRSVLVPSPPLSLLLWKILNDSKLIDSSGEAALSPPAFLKSETFIAVFNYHVTLNHIINPNTFLTFSITEIIYRFTSGFSNDSRHQTSHVLCTIARIMWRTFVDMFLYMTRRWYSNFNTEPCWMSGQISRPWRARFNSFEILSLHDSPVLSD